MKRCDKTELPADQCVGACCRPDLKTPPVERARPRVVFEARYRSKCDHCEGVIEPGERMGFDADDNRVCGRHLA